MEINFRADREAHLRTLCEEMGRSVDDFVTEAILTFMEDYEDGRDAQAALAEGGPTIHAGRDGARLWPGQIEIPEQREKTA